MPKYILDNKNNTIKLTLESEKSKIIIKSVSVNFNETIKENWVVIIPKIKIEAELSFPIFIEQSNQIIDSRTLSTPVHLQIDPFQKSPTFNLNQQINNESFTIGINPELKYFNTLKIILQNTIDLDFSVEIHLEIE